MIASGCTAALLATAAIAATPEENMAAYQKRKDVMKEQGRALFRDIGNVLKGTATFGPDTVAAAETVVRTSATLGTLFPVGSDVGDSKLKPELFADRARADQMIAATQKQAGALLVAVKTGDKDKIAPAVKATTDACGACHTDFRKKES